tara:strand:- start:15069 stop:15503 length:435 start_codon:yes stop_codon:yes gene_type:complete
MRGTDARVFGRLTASLAMLAVALLQVGCSGSTRIDGRVVSGPVGLAVVVDPSDDRLSEPGIPGVEVALLRESSGSSGGAMITRAVSDEAGNFTFTLARGQHPAGPVSVRTRGDGVFTSRSRSYLPRGNQRLLCTVMTQPERGGP